MARKYHGIHKAEYSTDSGSSYTEINNVVAGESQVEFPDQDGPQDLHGGVYDSNQYVEATVRALDLTAQGNLETEHGNDNGVTFRLTLDNSATMTTDIDVLPTTGYNEITIEGTAEGRSDGFEFTFRAPKSDVTFA